MGTERKKMLTTPKGRKVPEEALWNEAVLENPEARTTKELKDACYYAIAELKRYRGY